MENNIEREKKELDLLIEKGVSFKVPKRSFLKHFGNKERVFEIKPLCAGTLYNLYHKFIEIDINENLLMNIETATEEAKRVLINSKIIAEIIAIAVLNSYLKLKLFKNILSKYFLWRITPKKMDEILHIIFAMENLPDFISSTRLAKTIPRQTAPKRVDTELPQA